MVRIVPRAALDPCPVTTLTMGIDVGDAFSAEREHRGLVRVALQRDGGRGQVGLQRRRSRPAAPRPTLARLTGAAARPGSSPDPPRPGSATRTRAAVRSRPAAGSRDRGPRLLPGGARTPACAVAVASRERRWQGAYLILRLSRKRQRTILDRLSPICQEPVARSCRASRSRPARRSGHHRGASPLR